AVELRQSRWPVPVLNPDRDEYTVRPVIFPEELMFEVENRDSGKAIRPESITAGRNIADQVLSRLHRGESTISLPLDTVLLLRLTPVERRSEFSGLRDWQLVRDPYPARADDNRELTLEFQYNPLPPLADDVIRMRHTARMEIAKLLGLDPERNWHDEVSQRSGLHARQWWSTEATRAALKAIKNHSGKITIACAALITMTQVFFRNNSQSLNAMSNQAERISAAR
ncbi:MAG: hypothetical protein H6618_05715, partial [Deltaproteobacteria bacterium]|nr:hypothetical protein [Deltaproteobacteria bacterium]